MLRKPAALLFVLLLGYCCPDSPAEEKGGDEIEAGKEKSLLNGEDLSGWGVIDKFDFKRHGEVKAVEGTVLLAAGRPATGIAYKGEFPRENYQVSLEARRVEGDDFFCGLTFPVGDSYCSLIIGGWGGGVTGLSNIDDLSAVENETTGYTKFENGRWYSIVLKVTAKKIEARLDGELLCLVEREDRRFSIWWEQEPARPFGIATWNTKGEVRKIKLKPIPGNEEK